MAVKDGPQKTSPAQTRPLTAKLERGQEVLHGSNMRLCLFLALIASLAPLMGAPVPTEKRVEMFYGMAQGNYLVGDESGAAKGIEEILRIQPDYLPALKLKARLLLDQGESEAALAIAEQAIALAPADLESQLLQALILGNLNRRDESIATIMHVLATAQPGSKDSRTANQLLGLLRMAEGHWDEAADAFNQNYLAAPEASAASLQLASEAYLEKARSAMAAKKTDNAILAIDQAIALHNNATGAEGLRQRSELRLLRARVLAQTGRTEAAITDLQALTAQEPNNLEALVTLASLYAATERWTSVEQLIEPISKQPQLQDIALYLEGRAALAQNRVGKARAKFEEALELQPAAGNRLAPSLHFYHSVCLGKLDRGTEAEAERLEALDAGFAPESAEEAILASRSLLRIQQSERAIPILEAMTLNRISATAEVWALLGRAQQSSGNDERAISAFNESLRIAPQQADVLALRGALFRKLGQLDAAAADYEHAILNAPENDALPYALGLIYFQLGNIHAASKMTAIAAVQHPERADIALLQALFDYTLGHYTESRTALEHYFELQTATPNESAYYLEYALTAQTAPDAALQALETHAVNSVPLGYFYSYCNQQLSRKEVLDHAGKATSRKAARAQICEALFWMAQHELATGAPQSAKELLQLAVDLQDPDLAEYQLARWQLGNCF